MNLTTNPTRSITGNKGMVWGMQLGKVRYFSDLYYSPATEGNNRTLNPEEIEGSRPVLDK